MEEIILISKEDFTMKKKKITEMTKTELLRNWKRLMRKMIKEKTEELPKALELIGDEVATERYLATDEYKKAVIRDVNRQILSLRYQKELTKRGYAYDVMEFAKKIGEEAVSGIMECI